MKVLDYYFSLEFQWRKNNWRSSSGTPRAKIYPANEFLANNPFVDYSILERIFVLHKRFKDSNLFKIFLSELLITLSGNNIATISIEGLNLEIRPDFSKPIDFIGDEIGIEAPLNWNITTPVEFQHIPTAEIIQLLQDWDKFLIILEENPVYVKMYSEL